MLVKRGGSMNYEDVGRRRPHTGARSIVQGVGLGNAVASDFRAFPERFRTPEGRQRDIDRQREKRAARTAARGKVCGRCRVAFGPESFYAKPDGQPMSYCRTCWSDYNRTSHLRRKAAA